MLVLISLQKFKHFLQENYVVQVEFRVILCNDILEDSGEFGKNRIVFLTEQLMCCVVYLQDDFRPQLQVLGDELLEEVDCVVRVLLVKEVPAFVLELDIDVPQHTQQQFLVKRKVILLDCEVINPREVSDLIQQYLAS